MPMKMRNIKFLFLGMFLLALIVFSSAQNVIAEDEPDREETFWMTGHHHNDIMLNPFGDGIDPMWTYEVLFDYDFKDDERVSILGAEGDDAIVWEDDGETIIINLREDAEFSDGEEVTADDVVYSYEAHAEGRFGEWNTRVEEIEASDDYEVTVTLDSDYAYSRTIWQGFHGLWVIIPEHVWSEIEDDDIAEIVDDGDIYGMTNNWLHEDFPDDWKVGSGAYQPFYQDDALTKKVYEKNDDWWGSGVLVDESTFDAAPKYIGHRVFPTDGLGVDALENNEIDLSAMYVPIVDKKMEKNELLGTWVDGSPYYLALSSMTEILLNHESFPYSELWFREALSYALNYENLITVAGGYTTRAKMGALDNNSPRWEPYFDAEVEEEFNVDDKGVNDALDVLKENCLPNPSFKIIYGDDYDEDDWDDFAEEGIAGGWYTEDIDEDVYGDTVAELAEWGIKDYLPLADGINMKLDGDADADDTNDGIFVIVPSNWADFVPLASAITLDVQNLGLYSVPVSVGWNGYDGPAKTAGADAFDMIISPMSPKLLEDPIRFLNYFIGESNNLWSNSSRWNEATSGDAIQDYIDAVADFEVAEEGSDDQMEAATEIQNILAENKPNIFLFPNGYWYTYNNCYWLGQPTEADSDFHLVTVWSTANFGLVELMLLNIHANPNISQGGTPAPIPFIAIFLGLAAVAILVAKKRRN